MVYEKFLETITTSLQEKLRGSYQLTVRQIPKNNGKILDGISIQQTGEPMAPTIYLNSYYQSFEDQDMTLEQILDDILLLLDCNPVPTAVNAEQIADFSYAKNKIMFKVIHAASNKALLADLPHLPTLDLAIIFYLFLEANESGQMTALIHHEHTDLWKVSEKELMTLALANTPAAFPANIKNMIDVMKEIAKEQLGDDFSEEMVHGILKGEEAAAPLYVLSNQTGIYGAACLLYPDVIKNFADFLDRDLIILPSSIHEVLITPDNAEMTYEDFAEMVTSINQNEVPPEDQLSNQVYLYRRDNERLEIVSHSVNLVG